MIQRVDGPNRRKFGIRYRSFERAKIDALTGLGMFGHASTSESKFGSSDALNGQFVTFLCSAGAAQASLQFAQVACVSSFTFESASGSNPAGPILLRNEPIGQQFEGLFYLSGRFVSHVEPSSNCSGLRKGN
jgi:hypothetical protein